MYDGAVKEFTQSIHRFRNLPIASWLRQDVDKQKDYRSARLRLADALVKCDVFLAIAERQTEHDDTQKELKDAFCNVRLSLSELLDDPQEGRSFLLNGDAELHRIKDDFRSVHSLAVQKLAAENITKILWRELNAFRAITLVQPYREPPRNRSDVFRISVTHFTNAGDPTLEKGFELLERGTRLAGKELKYCDILNMPKMEVTKAHTGGNTFVGFSLARNEGDFRRLYCCCVHPHYRSIGIGSGLVQAEKETMTSYGLRGLRVSDYADDAAELFGFLTKHHGFAVKAREQVGGDVFCTAEFDVKDNA